MLPMKGPILMIYAILMCTGCRPGTHGNTLTGESIDEGSGLLARYSFYIDAKGVKVRHGAMILFYNDGSKYIEAKYFEGLLHGVCHIYDRKGGLSLSGEYRNGIPWNGGFQVGHEIEYFSNGKPRQGVSR